MNLARLLPALNRRPSQESPAKACHFPLYILNVENLRDNTKLQSPAVDHILGLGNMGFSTKAYRIDKREGVSPVPQVARTIDSLAARVCQDFAATTPVNLN